VTYATTAIFAYWWLVPTALYGLLWWRGNQAGFTFTELLCVYGYSLTIYIPISVGDDRLTSLLNDMQCCASLALFL
jgi:protein YIPF1/2